MYVTLPSNSSMDIFPDNKVSHFKVNLPEVLKVDPENWEVALKEIQFPHLWYNVRDEKNYFTGWFNSTIGVGRLKKSRVEIKFMKEVKPGYYSSVSELIAELNSKLPSREIDKKIGSSLYKMRFDYDQYSNKTSVTIPEEVYLVMEGSGLAMRLRFKESEILRGPGIITSKYMCNMDRYSSLYVYTDIIQNQLVGDVRAPLLRVVPVTSKYGEVTCVTYEQPHFLPLSRSNIQTIEIYIRSDTGELISFESGKSVVTLVFRRKFY